LARQLYVYGVARDPADRLELPAGVAGAPAFLHRRGDVSAVVGVFEADGPVAGTPKDVRAHEQVLRAALDGARSLVPFRFGGLYPDEAALDERVLDPSADVLERLLDELEGLVELQLRALYPDQEALIRDLVAEDPGLLRLRERARRGGYHEQLALGEATVAAFELRRSLDQELVRSRLGPLARDWRERDELPERVAAQFAFLVERARLAEFEAEAERVAAEEHERLRLSLVGPLPAYSFVAFELEAAEVG